MHFRDKIPDVIDTDLDMTSPTTSSITAALTRTEPTRVWARLTLLEAEAITAKVVPKHSWLSMPVWNRVDQDPVAYLKRWRRVRPR